LGDVGESIVPDLIGALKDPSALVRSGAAQALALVGYPARPALDALRKCLNDPDATVRSAADSAIKEILKPSP
jgi:HEAT repeat protein